MEDNSQSPKRIRRTKIAVDRDVLNAVNSLVEEIGFSNITLTAIAQKAKIESTVFYRRYNSLEDLFSKYTEKYDFWFSNITKSIPQEQSDKEKFKTLLISLINSLYRSKGMQQLLIWELSDENKTTRKTAKLREAINEPLIKLIESHFKNSNININVVSALVIAGIYFLILHRKISTFCNVDFSTRKGKLELERNIEAIVDLLFEFRERHILLEGIASKLKSEGVSDDIILKCLY